MVLLVCFSLPEGELLLSLFVSPLPRLSSVSPPSSVQSVLVARDLLRPPEQ